MHIQSIQRRIKKLEDQKIMEEEKTVMRFFGYDYTGKKVLKREEEIISIYGVNEIHILPYKMFSLEEVETCIREFR